MSLTSAEEQKMVRTNVRFHEDVQLPAREGVVIDQKGQIVQLLARGIVSNNNAQISPATDPAQKLARGIVSNSNAQLSPATDPAKKLARGIVSNNNAPLSPVKGALPEDPGTPMKPIKSEVILDKSDDKDKGSKLAVDSNLTW